MKIINSFSSNNQSFRQTPTHPDKAEDQLMRATQYKVPNYQTKSAVVTTMNSTYEGAYPVRGTQVYAKNPSPYDRLAMRKVSPTNEIPNVNSSIDLSQQVEESTTDQVSFAEIERDVDYMKQLYPNTAKKILSIIEDECDRLDYSGSCIYDEYPDRITIDRIIDRLYANVPDREQEAQLEIQNYNHHNNNDLLRDMISIIFLNEIQHRRRRRCHRHRGCRY